MGFYGISTIGGNFMPNPLCTWICLIRFGWFLWHIKLVGYLIPNPLYTYISNICIHWYIIYMYIIDISNKYTHTHTHTHTHTQTHKHTHKHTHTHTHIYIYIYIYIYSKNIWLGLVGFHNISTIVGYLMPNTFYTYILNINGLVWFGLVWLVFMLCYTM